MDIKYILSLLKNVNQDANGYKALCPAHDDKEASLSISQGDDGRILFYCHAGCDVQDITTAIGIEVKDLFPQTSKTSKKEIECVYDYCDANGKLIYQAVRFTPKGFAQRQPDGKGGWIWNMRGVKPVPFKLSHVLNAIKNDEFIFIVEGEKDVLNLVDIGLTATCNHGGAGKWKVSHSRYFKAGAKVIILPDNDKPGHEHAQNTAKQLYENKCEIKVLTLPGLPPKGDVTDWINSGGTKDKLLRLAAGAPCWEPSGDSDDHSNNSNGSNLPTYFYYDEKKGKMCVNRSLLAKHIREKLDYFFVKDSAHGGVLKYVYQDGCYRLFNDEMFKGVIKPYITDFCEEILEMRDVNEVFQQLITDLVFKNNNELNANEDVINFKNGVLRLSDMALLPHSPRLLSTIQIPCVWTGQPSDTPVFDSFIAELTNWDKAIENLLLEFVGACISNIKGHRMKKALFMVGLGDTGKSRLKELTETLLGKGNYFPIDLRELEERFATGNVYNKRLIGSSDMSFLTVKELKIFKKLTGGDSIPAEFKGVQGFNFTYCGLMWFCMNKLPKFGGDDGEWVHERIIQVECKNKIPPERQDKFLLDKMYEERNGIIYKAVMALRNVITNGYKFSEPDSVIVARRKYMEENNTVIAFFDECMVKRPTAVIPTNDGCTTGRVYDVYKAWCKDNNHGYAKTAKEFRDELAQHLGFSFSEISVRRGKGGTFYRRYTLSDEAKSQYHDAYGNNYMFTVG